MLIMVWEHNVMLCWKFRGTCWNSYWTKSKCRFRRARSLSLACRRISDAGEGARVVPRAKELACRRIGDNRRRGRSSTYSKEYKFIAHTTIMYTLCNYKKLQSLGYWLRKITSAVSHPTMLHNEEQWWCKYRPTGHGNALHIYVKRINMQSSQAFQWESYNLQQARTRVRAAKPPTLQHPS